MMKVLMVYTSQSVFSNTKQIADAIRDAYQANGASVTLLRFEDLPTDLSFNDYDHVDFGMYTWEDGAIPFETVTFYGQISERLNKDVSTSVFGSGDSFYPNFCGALDTYREKLSEHSDFKYTLRIELSPQEIDMPRIEAYAKSNLGIASK